jgi:DNA repair protein RecO (recombination protein O)
MQWQDQAIILNVKKFSEDSAIVHLFTPNYGLYKGAVSNITSKSNIATLQIGNTVNATWKARLPEHLGNFNLELTKQVIAYLINSKKKLLALACFCNLLDNCLAERQLEKELFDASEDFIAKLCHQQDFIIDYVAFELLILEKLGFGLNLNKCAVSETTENLIYVSPKTARAVCASVGAQYHDKLLPLPAFLVKTSQLQAFDAASKSELYQALNLTGYFLEKHFYKPKNLKLPIIRKELVEG